MIHFYELRNSCEDIEILRKFYNDLYVLEFPDPNERESLFNMEEYLRLKDLGWYKENNYHIVILLEDEYILGGCIFDYLSEAKAGVIEFIFVSNKVRGNGYGSRLLSFTEDLLKEDARVKKNRELSWIIAEMNNPNLESLISDNLNPKLRAKIWNKWEYSVLDFSYIQPSLSKDQAPVDNLCIIAKVFNSEWQKNIPSIYVKKVIHEYLYWAMRIKSPFECPEFCYMCKELDSKSAIKLIDLNQYVIK